ncbi:MAG: hypothetical protein DMF69_16760, partial [Acidobacteria bacterium]
MAAFSASYKPNVKHFFLPIGQLGGQGYYQTTIVPIFEQTLFRLLKLIKTQCFTAVFDTSGRS